MSNRLSCTARLWLSDPDINNRRCLMNQGSVEPKISCFGCFLIGYKTFHNTITMNSLSPYNNYPINSTSCTEKCWSKFIDGKLQCDCGNDIQIVEWFWAQAKIEDTFKLDLRDFTVTFHPIYSTGTSVVRGDIPFKRNMHYYWELKMISKLYGTDVMVGVGTTEGLGNLAYYRFRFCSMLGSDDQTWGYSYHGNIQHDKLTRQYGKPFGLATRVGIHLDMYTGKLEYYHNRIPLGIAFTGLKDKELHPMACATAAQSSMKLVCAVSQEQTLQMLCLKQVLKNRYLYEEYSSIPGLYKSCSRKYFWMVPCFGPKPSVEEEEDELYTLALNNNSSKRKQNINHTIPPTNKKSSKGQARSSRRSRRDISPLRLDLGVAESSRESTSRSRRNISPLRVDLGVAESRGESTSLYRDISPLRSDVGVAESSGESTSRRNRNISPLRIDLIHSEAADFLSRRRFGYLRPSP